MKRTFSVLMMAVLLVTALGFRASPVLAAGEIEYLGAQFLAEGKGVVFIFDITGLKNRDVRDVTIFVNSDLYHLGCTVSLDGDKLTCTQRGDFSEFAGKPGIIFINGQIFYVTIPSRSVLDEPVITEEPKSPEEPVDPCGPLFLPGSIILNLFFNVAC